MFKESEYAPAPGEYPARRDTVRYDVQEHVYLTTYWKVLANGKGPATSLFVHGEEVLKFDCFGRNKGHCHIGFARPKKRCRERLYLAEQTVEEQIARTAFELTVNLPYYLDRHPARRVRSITLDAQRFKEIVDKVCLQMLEFQRAIPELRTTDE
jgi:hypothetical protein